VLAIDVRRYDAWVLDAVAGLRTAGGKVVAVTDGPLSPLVVGGAPGVGGGAAGGGPGLVVGADAWFAVAAEGAGPFDSHVGTLALLHALVAGVADRLRGSATDRLDRIETAWRETGSLHD
jgi:DNA-binding MurR/RpiR family transcriptional regulator